MAALPSDGCYRVLAVSTSDGCANEWWLSYRVMAVLLSDGCATEWWLSYRLMTVLPSDGCITGNKFGDKTGVLTFQSLINNFVHAFRFLCKPIVSLAIIVDDVIAKFRPVDVFGENTAAIKFYCNINFFSWVSNSFKLNIAECWRFTILWPNTI